MTAESLARELENFLAEARDAVVVEDGEAIFELSGARYSISDEHGKCVLHMWSEERNSVRRVLDAENRNGVLQLAVQRFGRSRPSKLEICPGRHDRRAPSARRATRLQFLRWLERVLPRSFPGYEVERLSSAMDLERSFGPAYARGIVHRGRSAFAVLGVNSQEPQSTIDGALTFALLWLDHCRRRDAGRRLVEGLKLLAPRGSSDVIRARLAYLDPAVAKFQLYEFEEREDAIEERDWSDGGNVATRLVRCPDAAKIRERFAPEVERVREQLPQAEFVPCSPAEAAFRWHGLEFARARLAPAADSLRSGGELVFGVVGCELRWSEETQPQLAALARRLLSERRPEGDSRHALWRMQPERWLESLVMEDVARLDARIEATTVHSQVPAFAAGDRAMIDILAATREGRLAVIELKADEDIHLPLQGLDYWARVHWHHQRGELTGFGYFPGRNLSLAAPILLLVAPSLHIHPATDALLRYLSPQVDWTVIGLDERWREGVRVVFRKRPERQLLAPSY